MQGDSNNPLYFGSFRQIGHIPWLNLGEKTLNKSLPKEFTITPIPIKSRGSPITIS